MYVNVIVPLCILLLFHNQKQQYCKQIRRESGSHEKNVLGILICLFIIYTSKPKYKFCSDVKINTFYFRITEENNWITHMLYEGSFIA